MAASLPMLEREVKTPSATSGVTQSHDIDQSTGEATGIVKETTSQERAAIKDNPPEVSLLKRIFAATVTFSLLIALGFFAGAGTADITNSDELGFVPAVPIWIASVVFGVKAWQSGRIFGRKNK